MDIRHIGLCLVCLQQGQLWYVDDIYNDCFNGYLGLLESFITLRAFKIIDHPDGRWLVQIYVWARQHSHIRDIELWLDQNIQSPAEVSYKFNNGDPYWSITGGPDQRDQLTACILQWGESN